MTEFKHRELVYNDQRGLFYYRTDLEGGARYQPIRADQGAYEDHRVTIPVLQAVKEGLCSAWRCLASAFAEFGEWACSDRVRVSFPVFDTKQIDKTEV